MPEETMILRDAALRLARAGDPKTNRIQSSKLFSALQLGGHGGVSGGANLFPKLYVKLCEAHRVGNLARAQELQNQIQRVSDSLYHIGKYSSTIIKGIKCALACQGI